MAKQPQQQKKPDQEKTIVAIPTIGIHDFASGEYKQVTHVACFQDLIDNWDGAPMGFPNAIYELEKEHIVKAAKSLNYGAMHKDSTGKHRPDRKGGNWYFKYYGKK